MAQRFRKLKLAALAACALAAVPAAAGPGVPATPAQAERQQQPRPRNIVFVLVDDLRFDAMGFLTRGLRTPNIDFLAKNGVHFSNAVVTSSLCSPSRATILTGQSARNHRVIDNNNSSEAGLTFFPTYLRQAGYQTAFIGKWHMGNDSDDPRPGFDKWVSFKGQGHYFPTDGLPPQAVASGARQQLNVDGRHVAQAGYITDDLTDHALDWLARGRDKSKPFFLYLSHKAVHSDATPPDRYRSQYADLPIRLPDTLADTPENRGGKPLWVQNQRNSWHGAEFPYHTDKPLTELVRDYYRTLSPVDDSLGRILKYLRDNRLDRDTMVVFTSDNGFLFGDHGLIDKRNAYEPSVRVPMLVYAPGLLPAGATNPALVRNLDLAPTLLDVAGVAAPPQMEGRSFLPIAEGKVAPAAWNEDFVYEYYWEWSFPQTPTTFAIERNRIKYIQYHGVWDTEELYDLDKDPEERRNLIADPAYLDIKLALRRSLFEKLANGKGEHVVPFTEKKSTGLVDRRRDGSRAADFPDEWYVAPNRPARMNGLFPDSPAKARADAEGRRYSPGQ